MGIEQIHQGSRIWHYVEDSKFVFDYSALEAYFNDKSREEGYTTEKQFIHLRTIEADPQARVLNLTAELYRLLEN